MMALIKQACLLLIFLDISQIGCGCLVSRRPHEVLPRKVPSDGRFAYGEGMSDELKFMMGKYAAVIPTDREYCSRHMWLQPVEGETSTYLVGFTSYSVRLLQDVYFLEWSIDAGSVVADRQEIGEVESSKAVSSMFTPCSGEVIEFNEAILNDPAVINSDCYGAGYLYKFRTNNALLTAAEYVAVLEEGWEKTQGTIKGQMH